MANDRTNLVDPKPLGDEVTDGLAPGVVKTNLGAGGQIDGGSVTGAAKEGVESCACDCEDGFCAIGWFKFRENTYCRATQRHLP